MTKGLVQTQGSEIFFIETISQSDPTIRKMQCPTGVTGVGGGTKDQIETTCLDTIGDKEYRAGLGNTAPVSVPFNLIPGTWSHRILLELKRSGEVVNWLVCLSESETDPTMDSDFEFVPPLDRTSFAFEGYVAECNIDVSTNEIVRGTLTIQRSGTEVASWNAPIEAGTPDPAA